MSLNPLVLLEKAINEHGSAVILRERLLLVREQMELLESKLLAAKEEVRAATDKVGELQVRNRQLQAEKEQLRVHAEELKKQVEDLQTRHDAAHSDLHANEETILTHLAKRDDATIVELATATGLGKQVIKLHVAALEAVELIEHFPGYIEDHYKLTNSGRKRMFQRGLLN